MNGRRILIVEDDAFSLKLMRDFLQAHGHETRETTNGLNVLPAAIDFAPDLVVMDIGIPGLNGVEATRRLKADAATRHIPVIAVTAYAMPGDEARARAAGCDAYLTKPLHFAGFIGVVDALLAETARYAGADRGTEK